MPSFYPKTAFLPDGRKRRKARIPFRNNKISHLSAESRLVKSALGLFLDLGRRQSKSQSFFPGTKLLLGQHLQKNNQAFIKGVDLLPKAAFHHLGKVPHILFFIHA